VAPAFSRCLHRQDAGATPTKADRFLTDPALKENDVIRIANYIGGALREPVGGEYLDNVDPSTGAVYSHVPDSDERDVALAAAAAESAFPQWSRATAQARSTVLLKIAELIDRDAEHLARAECVDNGKPITLARTVDIPRAAANFRFFATAILHTRSELYETSDSVFNYILRRPRGIAGLISPWNLPLYLFSWKVAPAIATGCTAVAKPSEITPMTAYLLCALCIEAGLPAGVLNVVHGRGPGAGQAIVAHPKITTISFTGGTATGAAVAETAGPMFKKLSLELGGKNPNVIFADADFDRALDTTVKSSFLNQGQICLCGSRIFIEESIFDVFVSGLVERARSLRIGDPLDENTQLGAMVSQAHYEKVLSYLELARKEGGRVLCGGGPARDLPERCRNGYFIEPTVLAGLGPGCRVNREEIFGPVVTVSPFSSESEVIERANDTRYGLSASIWTRDLSRGHRVAAAIESGTVWLNCWLVRDLRVPFGGTKSSGVGREGGEEALRCFTEAKNVCVQT
jgi:aminomuconate-semialdehyde/2-hydroxymuconate-6-semialdehyde dehydrogenase